MLAKRIQGKKVWSGKLKNTQYSIWLKNQFLVIMVPLMEMGGLFYVQ